MAKNQSTEDYVKGIYKLQQQGKSVPTSILARHLKIGDGSVTDMIKKLSMKKLVEYTPYRGVSLTHSGKRLALKMVRRHRLWEMFLVKYLGYKWNEIHDEAERLEHMTSDEMEERLDRALGYPKTDPHGDPIPNMRGEVEGMCHSPLSDFNSGDVVRIVRVSDDDANILQHASEIGLALKRKVIVTKKRSFDGSMVVRTGSKEHYISRNVAQSVFVERA